MKVLFESRDPDAARLRDVAVGRVRFVKRRLAWLVPRAMRTYPIDSPPAAARILALAALADGHLSAAEIDTLERLCTRSRLGLAPTEFREVIRALCEDLLSTADHNWSAACRVDRQSLATLMAEIEDPDLRQTVLELCVATIEADAHVADGEALVVRAALEDWHLRRN